MVRAVWPEDVEVGRKVRRSQAAVAEERRICARFTGGLVDSFGGDDQHEEAELWVPSAWRGEAGIDVVSANCSRWCSHREEKEEGDGGGGRKGRGMVWWR
jgi:hypothetical protein